MLVIVFTIVSAVLLSAGVIGTLRALKEHNKFYTSQVRRAALGRRK